MMHVVIIHEVADYFVWKKVFDNAETIRKEAGEISFQLLKFEHEPNKIVHFSKWTSLVAAKQFFESPKLVKIREEAGVKTPQFIYLKEIESAIL
jgi:quinol monooxygenase YgiN